MKAKNGARASVSGAHNADASVKQDRKNTECRVALEIEWVAEHNQYSPVAPNALPVANSVDRTRQSLARGSKGFSVDIPHIPAANWARPPTKQAIPMTALGTEIPRAWTLYIERMKVVLAKEKRPLWTVTD